MKNIDPNFDAGRLHLVCEDGDTDQLRRIVGGVLPDTMDRFARKNAQYGEASFDLGIRGQFADMYRKMVLLKKAMWDAPESELEFEPLEEILDDMIGHALLSLDLLGQTRREASGKSDQE